MSVQRSLHPIILSHPRLRFAQWLHAALPAVLCLLQVGSHPRLLPGRTPRSRARAGGRTQRLQGLPLWRPAGGGGVRQRRVPGPVWAGQRAAAPGGRAAPAGAAGAELVKRGGSACRAGRVLFVGAGRCILGASFAEKLLYLRQALASSCNCLRNRVAEQVCRHSPLLILITTASQPLAQATTSQQYF